MLVDSGVSRGLGPSGVGFQSMRPKATIQLKHKGIPFRIQTAWPQTTNLPLADLPDSINITL